MDSRQLSIGIFINTYKPVKNGVVISTSLLKKGLEDLGHKVSVFTLSFPNSPEEEGVIRFPAFKLPKVDFSYPILPLRSRVKRALETTKLDIYLIEHPFLLGTIGAEEGKKKGIPVVFTFHTQYKQYLHYLPLVPYRIKEKLLEGHLNRFFKKVDRVVVPSRTFISEAIAYGVPEEKIVHIPNPVDLRKFSPPSPQEKKVLRKKYSLPLKGKIVGFVGRLAVEKNLSELLEVFLLIQNMDGDVHFLLVGGGPVKPQLEAEAKKLGLKKVSFIGPLEPEVIPEIYKTLDVFATCSLSEVKPLAYLEAFATGIPIVAYDSQGANDTIENNYNGLLIPPGEKGQMAKGILTLLKDEELWNKLSRGALKSAENYSLEKVTRRYEDLFRELTNKTR